MTQESQLFSAVVAALATRGIPASDAIAQAHEYVAAAFPKPDEAQPEPKAKPEPKTKAE
jgi:hydroxymethylpyrimidine/phosphomethylpyrimidine kinase